MNRTGLILWLTGLSGSGKTTIANGMMSKLRNRNYLVEILDGDVIRTNLSKGLSFSREDRETNLRRIHFVANLLSRHGVVVIVAAISPYRAIRNEFRSSTKNFIEIYVNAPLELCEERDVKGLYVKARAGEIKAFTGIDDIYEEPLNPHIICYSGEENISESVDKIFSFVEHKLLNDNELDI
jgi:adenylylsulfate kinase